eukprot:6284043-Pyramimonas_sp.AAC.1
MAAGVLQHFRRPDGWHAELLSLFAYRCRPMLTERDCKWQSRDNHDDQPFQFFFTRFPSNRPRSPVPPPIGPRP